MSYRVKDRIEISLFINGKEFPFDRSNVLNFLHMSSSTRIALPMLRFSIVDSVHWLTKNTDLVDGAPIQIIIREDSKQVSYKFRYNTSNVQQGPSGLVYDIDGYYDAPLYWLKSTTEAINGTSSDALAEIAKLTGLAYEGVKTADSQIWLPMNKKYHKFVKDIVDHAYMTDRSCMQSVVTLGGTLKFRNVCEVPNQMVRFVSGKYVEGCHLASDFKPKSKSGMLNTMSGYASKAVMPSFQSSDVSSVEKISVTRNTARLAVNSQLHRNVTEGAVQHRPIDCGNVHQNYERGLYQNRRMSNLYSIGMDILTPDFTEIDPLDYISFEANTTDQAKHDKTNSGAYVVSSKAIYVQGLHYFERFEVCRTGIDAAVIGQK